MRSLRRKVQVRGLCVSIGANSGDSDDAAVLRALRDCHELGVAHLFCFGARRDDVTKS
jgi:hypothetical protein